MMYDISSVPSLLVYGFMLDPSREPVRERLLTQSNFFPVISEIERRFLLLYEVNLKTGILVF